MRDETSGCLKNKNKLQQQYNNSKIKNKIKILLQKNTLETPAKLSIALN